MITPFYIYSSFLKILNKLNPIMMLFVRFWMARVFFNSGLTKIANWENTIALFRDEYKTPILPPDVAAVISTIFELGCPVFLVIGLFTRLTTLPLLAMTAVIQFTYDSNIQHAYWAMLLGMILFYGPNKISLDYFLSKQLTLSFSPIIKRKENE